MDSVIQAISAAVPVVTAPRTIADTRSGVCFSRNLSGGTGSPEDVGIEVSAGARRAAGARSAVQDQHRHAVRIAHGLPVQTLSVRHVEGVVVVRFDERMQHRHSVP